MQRSSSSESSAGVVGWLGQWGSVAIERATATKVPKLDPGCLTERSWAVCSIPPKACLRRSGAPRPHSRRRVLPIEVLLKVSERLPDVLRLPEVCHSIDDRVVLQLQQRGELLFIKFLNANADIV